MNIKVHHILLLLLGIVISIGVVFPVIDQGISEFQRTEESITENVQGSINELESSDEPIKYTISQDSTTETYYRNTSERLQVKLVERESTKIYKVQTEETIDVAKYNYSSPVGINRSKSKPSRADQSELIDYYSSLNKLNPILINYETETALRVNSYTKNGTTTEKYVVSHVTNSETIDITLTNDRVTNIDMGNMTVTITYNAERPDRPEDPEQEIPDRTETSTPQN